MFFRWAGRSILRKKRNRSPKTNWHRCDLCQFVILLFGADGLNKTIGEGARRGGEIWQTRRI